MTLKILLVEDDVEIVDHVTHALAESGHRVDSVADGCDGLSQALSGDYAALILDRMLPGMDGLEIVKRLRAEGSETPVLLLTTGFRAWKAAPTITWSSLSPSPNCWRGCMP